jgi:Icc-related predicted phosphoesterase
MTLCFFVSDLHGQTARYHKLFERIVSEKPPIVFMGGDLLPAVRSAFNPPDEHQPVEFLQYFETSLKTIRQKIPDRYPEIFLIPGNDDPASAVEVLREGETNGLWKWMHKQRVIWNQFSIYGYACVPPTPFLLKDWERYDVSKFIDPGNVAPEEGWHSVPYDEDELRNTTIQEELNQLTDEDDLSNAVFLFHAPPYQSKLDRAALDGMSIEHVPLDVHIGSIAIQRFIEQRQPLLTLHGHVHESSRLTGEWKERIGRTVAISAAIDSRELSLVRFELEAPENATRELI